MKRIVVCCDGTSNKFDALNVTNVAKIARSVASTSADGEIPQVVFYDQGVGSHGFRDTITGGAFGHGLAKNIQEAYRFIVLNYAPGDELFLFGFSRGAFTVRSLSGLITKFGVLDATEIKQIRPTMDLYRDQEPRSTAKTHEVEIKFLGVWDTVGAMGIQANRITGALGYWTGYTVGRAGRALRITPKSWTPDLLRRKFASAGRSISGRLGLNRGRYSFHDATLSERVKNGYHAVAIDERRPIFEVVLWNKEPAPGQHIEQVWFSGVHTEVGDGSPNVNASAEALKWMSDRAGERGLTFTDEFEKEVSGLLGSKQKPISRSPSGPWRLAGRLRRTLGASGWRAYALGHMVNLALGLVLAAGIAVVVSRVG